MELEFAAFKALMAEEPILADKIVSTVRKDGDTTVRGNYVVAKSGAPDRINDARMSMVNVFDADRRYTWIVRVVATSDAGVDMLGTALLRQVIGKTLEVMDRTCTAIELVPDIDRPDGYDRSADLIYRDFTFRFWSNRPVLA